jgi:hypothetical protein
MRPSQWWLGAGGVVFQLCILWGRGGGASSCESVRGTRSSWTARRGFFSPFFLPRRLSLPSSSHFSQSPQPLQTDFLFFLASYIVRYKL